MEAKEDIQDSKDCKEGGQSARKEDIQDSNESMCTVLHCVPFASRYKTARTASKASRASKGVQASRPREGRANEEMQPGNTSIKYKEEIQVSAYK